MVCQSINRNTSLYYVGGGSPLGDGVEISTFTSTLGIGETPSSLEVEVLWNPCTGLSAYIDKDCIGMAVIFTSNKFVFSGIIKKWTYNESDSGIKHKITIVDPRDLLSMVKVSLSSYHCILTKNNFMNVLNYIEGDSTNAVLCSGTYSPGVDLPAVNNAPGGGGCATWGTAGNGQRGVSYIKAIDGIIAYNPYMVTTAGISIYLDFNGLSAILLARAPYAVTSESNMPLSQLIQSACDACGMEYMVNLVGFSAVFTYIDRSIPVLLGQIGKIVKDAKTNGTLISSDIGVEEAKEVTSRVVFGDRIHYIKENNYPNGNNQKMFMGWVENVAIVRTVPEFATDGAPIDIRPLKTVLSSYGVSTGWIEDFPLITEKEVLSLGSVDFWKTVGLMNKKSICYKAGAAIFGTDWTGIAAQMVIALGGVLGNGKNVITSTLGSVGDVISKMYTNKNSTQKVAFLLDDVVFSFLKEWADEYYGKQWLIPIVGNSTGTCINRTFESGGPRSAVWAQGEAGTTFIADTPVDSAYPDSTSILGLIAGTYDTTLFETDEGKISTIIAFPASAGVARYINWASGTPVSYAINFELLGEHYQTGGKIYMKADTTGEVFKIMHDGYMTLHALIKTPFIPLMPVAFGDLNSNGLIALGLLLGMSTLAADRAAAVTKAGGTASEINILKSAPAIGPFTACAVPMKSNMYCYGPWTASTKDENQKDFIGETEIVDSPDLNPWQYGGVASMANIGQLLASAGLKSRNRSETGRVELAEAPGYSLGNIISNGDGPLLTSVVCRFDGGGVTTSYEFKTYTQKFGNFAKELADRTKSSVASRREIYKVVRNQRQKQLSLANKARKDAFKSISKLGNTLGDRSELISGVGQRGGTLQRLLFSFYPAQTGLTAPEQSFKDGVVDRKRGDGFTNYACTKALPSTANGSKSTPGDPNTRKLFSDAGFEKSFTIEHFQNAQAYNKYAICSLDFLYSPVSLFGSGGLPRFASEEDPELRCSNQKFRNVPPPTMPYYISNLSNQGTTPNIRSFLLNPVLTKSCLPYLGTFKDGTTEGVSIKSISFGDDPDTLLVMTPEQEEVKQQATDYRFPAMKGPLVLHSWGYDTDGKPIPNAVDSPGKAELGAFNSCGLMDKFMVNWTSNSKTWPVGPIDLRWDRARRVWVSPPPEKILLAQVLDYMPKGVMGSGVLLSGYSNGSSPVAAGLGDFYGGALTGPDGEQVSYNKTRIILMDFLGRTWKKGARVYASHMANGSYIILEGCNTCIDDNMNNDDCSEILIRQVSFTAPWAKNGTMNVSYMNGMTTAVISGVLNPIVSVTGTGSKAAIIAKGGVSWYLIASEC